MEYTVGDVVLCFELMCMRGSAKHSLCTIVLSIETISLIQKLFTVNATVYMLCLTELLLSVLLLYVRHLSRVLRLLSLLPRFLSRRCVVLLSAMMGYNGFWTVKYMEVLCLCISLGRVKVKPVNELK
jgi:hypothetical protein